MIVRTWTNTVTPDDADNHLAHLTKKLKRSAHTSVKDLATDINTWLDAWNDDPSRSSGTRPRTKSSAGWPATAPSSPAPNMTAEQPDGTPGSDVPSGVKASALTLRPVVHE
jgi:hypothetical protein